MKRFLPEILAFIFLLTLPSCVAVAGGSKAGMFIGLFVIVSVVILQLLIISSVSNK